MTTNMTTMMIRNATRNLLAGFALQPASRASAAAL